MDTLSPASILVIPFPFPDFIHALGIPARATAFPSLALTPGSSPKAGFVYEPACWVW